MPGRSCLRQPATVLAPTLLAALGCTYHTPKGVALLTAEALPACLAIQRGVSEFGRPPGTLLVELLTDTISTDAGPALRLRLPTLDNAMITGYRPSYAWWQPQPESTIIVIRWGTSDTVTGPLGEAYQLTQVGAVLAGHATAYGDRRGAFPQTFDLAHAEAQHVECREPLPQ